MHLISFNAPSAFFSTYTIGLIAPGISSWWPSGSRRLILWRQKVLGTAGEELPREFSEFDVFHTSAQFFGLRRNNDRRIGNRFLQLDGRLQHSSQISD